MFAMPLSVEPLATRTQFNIQTRVHGNTMLLVFVTMDIVSGIKKCIVKVVGYLKYSLSNPEIVHYSHY